MQGRSPKAVNAGLKPDEGPKPNAGNARLKPDARNAGPKLDAGSKPNAWPKPNARNAGLKLDAGNAGPKPDVVNARLKPNAGRKPKAGPKPNAGRKPKAGPKPTAINSGSEPDAGRKLKSGAQPDAERKPKSGADARCSKCRAAPRCRAEAQKWGQSPKVWPKPDAVNVRPKTDAGLKPNVRLKPNTGNAEPKPNVVNAGPKLDAGSKPKSDKCIPNRKVQEMQKTKVNAEEQRGALKVGRPSVHSSLYPGGRVKAAGGLPAKVSMTRRSCGVGGRAGRPLVIARLAMER
ncbi:hypothetical protein CRG98_027031 [Punica granatum]|uniref:Uncharacterized protein n=2 Tax=Punica granatum TaxID=22663 RepID=A0A2I0J9A8_PUNGR|nr:hypothetical protein CRG98_027031 [Punica granatum]